MPAKPAIAETGAAPGRKFFVGVGVAAPSPSHLFRRLSHIPEDLRLLTEAFARIGYAPVSLGDDDRHDLSREDFRKRLSAWINEAALGPNDALALYFTGHGYASGSHHYLCFQGFDHNEPSLMGLSALELGMLLLDRPTGTPGRLWILLDCCMAAAAAKHLAETIDDISHRLGSAFCARITAAAGQGNPAFDGAFSRAFAAAVEDGARSVARIEESMRAAWTPSNPQSVFVRNAGAAWNDGPETEPSPRPPPRAPLDAKPAAAKRAPPPTPRRWAWWLGLLALGTVAGIGLVRRRGHSIPPAVTTPDGPARIHIAAGSLRAGLTRVQAMRSYGDCLLEYKNGCDPWEKSAFSRSVRDEGAKARSIDSFWLDRREVTVRDFAAWLNGNQRWTVDPRKRGSIVDQKGRAWLSLDNGPFRYTGGGVLAIEGKEELPATGMSQVAAAQYCAEHRGRLPTEDEWELAARGPQGRGYPWGDARPTDCHHAVFGRAKGGLCVGLGVGPAPATARRSDVSADGVQDLGGNVSEWTATAYEGSSNDEKCPVGEPCHVMRGGSYLEGALFLQSGLRYRGRDTGTFPSVGFRCAADAP